MKPGLLPPLSFAAICLLLGIVAIVAWFANEHDQQTELVRQTLTVERHIATLMLSIQDAETGQRGFLLTADEEYLAPYRAARPQIAVERQVLARLLADNARQTENLATLNSEISDKLSIMEASISLMRAHGAVQAARALRTNDGKESMDRIRAIIATIRLEETRLLDQRTLQMKRATIRLRMAVLGLAFVIVSLGALILFAQRAGRRELIASRDALALKNSELQSEITSRREIESQIVQMQKMETIGQLTGGIAHDFNNMLAVVIGGLNLIQRRLARGDHDVGALAEAATDAARRAAALTARLLTFSRQLPQNPETLNPNKLVAGMSTLLHQTLGADVEIETVLAAGLWSVRADVSELENTILNLALNARDAMGAGGGKITIETANSHLDDAYASKHVDVLSGQYTLIAMSDTGPGMAPEVLAKVFEPFFTTKPVGEGTGLGLAQAFGFVKQSGGHIQIYSEPGHGTVVKLYLPRVVGEDARAISETKEDEPVRGDSTNVILVVDDEERVRQITVATLRELGYTVIHAAGPSEALDKLRAHPGIDLLFTDVVMPKMNGVDLANLAVSEHPELKVLFASGFARNASANNGLLDLDQNFLMKPFSMGRLATKVASVLAKSG
ncbi:MAG: histidine kinase [Alphaproteobacteria bacterium]|nr:MAG: histidine kinase [Alphaproteobacteria bacterium]